MYKKVMTFLVSTIAVLVLFACGSTEEIDTTSESSEPRNNSSRELTNESESEIEEEEKKDEELSEQAEETIQTLEDDDEEIEIEHDSDTEDVTLEEDEVTELLEFAALGENDRITDLRIENGEILAKVEIGDNDMFDDKSILAENVYSRAGDELLEYEDWEVLTIEFLDIGRVSLDRFESETNEYGMHYFPSEKIIEQLNN